MKYFATIIAIVLVAAAIAWGVFFSGFMVKKKTAEIKTEGKIVVFETNFGTIKIKTDHEAAPRTSSNFEKLASEKFYDTLSFHRVVPGFVIQGGDPKGDGTGGPGYTVPAEIKLAHKRGSVAMARLPDGINPNKESSGSQFYIALQDLPGLDREYTVFGEVISGMDVVEEIAKVGTDPGDKPQKPVIINKANVE